MEFQRQKRLVCLATDKLKPRLGPIYGAWGRCRSYGCSMFPPPNDFACNSVVKNIFDLSSDEAADRNAFYEALLPELPRIAEVWRDDLMSQINKYLRSLFSDLPNDVDLTQLAQCHYFRCKTGRSPDCAHFRPIPLHYLLSHECFTMRPEPEAFTGDMEVDARDFYFDSTRWTINDDVVEPCVSQMRHIITAFGQDPTSVTVVEMDRLETRVWCTRCAEEYPHSRIILTWREAVSHLSGLTAMTPHLMLSSCIDSYNTFATISTTPSRMPLLRDGGNLFPSHTPPPYPVWE